MVTRKDIQQIARPSMLTISDKELDSLSEDMEQIIQFANTVATAQLPILPESSFVETPDFLRPDCPTASYPREEVLKNASCPDHGYFCVEKGGYSS